MCITSIGLPIREVLIKEMSSPVKIEPAFPLQVKQPFDPGVFLTESVRIQPGSIFPFKEITLTQ